MEYYVNYYKFSVFFVNYCFFNLFKASSLFVYFIPSIDFVSAEEAQTGETSILPQTRQVRIFIYMEEKNK